MKTTKKKKKSFLDYIVSIILVAAIGVFIYAAYNLFLIFSEYKAGEDTYEGLRDYVEMVEPEDVQSQPEGEMDAENAAVLEAQLAETAPIVVDFEKLQQVNPDIIGWIYMEAIPSISYPIVQGEDNDYYLHHTVEGVRNSSASIFMDFQNTSDFSDANTIIYGHNMKNQSMFGLLKQYKSEETCAKSPYFWILTPQQDYRYELFSVREVNERDEVYSLYSSTGDGFKSYLERMQAESVVAFDLEFDGTEKVVTLSTCTTDASKRCVVQGVRKDEM